MEWISVLKTKNAQEAQICKMLLIENQIDAVIFDKKDSIYPILGELDVKVLQKDLNRAISIINTLNAE